MDRGELLSELAHAAAKVALEQGEEWRLQHPEFMDALDAAYNWQTVLAEYSANPTTVFGLTLAQLQERIMYWELHHPKAVFLGKEPELINHDG